LLQVLKELSEENEGLSQKAQSLNSNLLEIAEKLRSLQEENDGLRAIKRDLTKQNKVINYYYKTR
jgi:predicted nuclease with TOPRIM domain